MTEQPGEHALPVRRYDGRFDHAPWCPDHTHDGLCLDVFLGLDPAPEQVKRPLAAMLGEYGYRLVGQGMHGDRHYFRAERSADEIGRNKAVR